MNELRSPRGHRLEAAWLGPPPDAAPTLVFLHEGLGSVRGVARLPGARRFGDRDSAPSSTAAGATARAIPSPLPRPLSYMHDEALAASLPEVLETAGVRRAVLLGHSDGGSIALVFAGSGLPAGGAPAGPRSSRRPTSSSRTSPCRASPPRPRRTAPPTCVSAWRATTATTSTAPSGAGTARGSIRASARGTSRSTCRASASPRSSSRVQDDPYGTLAQVEAIETKSGGPVSRLVLPSCGHSPHRDQPEATIEAVARFVASLPTG